MIRLRWTLIPVVAVLALTSLWLLNGSGKPQTSAPTLADVSAAGTDNDTTSSAVALPEGTLSTGTTPMLVLRMALALLLVLGLIIGAVRALRALGWGRRAPQGGHVRVLDRCWLGPRKALYTVRVGERHVVVGVTDASIQPVLELSSQEGTDLYSDMGSDEEAPGFADVLRKALGKVGRT